MKRLLMMIGAAADLTAKALAAAVAVGATLPMAAMAEAKSVVLQATGYTGTATISGFQALVKLTEGAYGFSYNDSESTDGSDLWFEDSSGNLVPHDIDEWNEGGVSYVWVRIPSLTPRTTSIAEITMHWGEVRTAAQTCTASDTWSGFAGVWHMNGTGTTSESDKTANGLDAAPLDSSNVSASLDTGTGSVGNGRAVSQGTFFKVSSHSSHLTSASVFTIGGWVKRTGSGSYPRIFVGNPDTDNRSYWEVYGESDTELHARGGGSTEHSCSANIGTDAGWNFLAVVFNGTTATVYTNGVVANSGTVNTSKQGEYFTIGGVGSRHDRSFVGTFDEVRMYNGTLSADRVAADYTTMTSPTTFLVAPSVAVSATWTGDGAVGDCTDPANWDCRNSSGGRIANAVPTFSTAVTLSGDNLNIQIPYG
ncbi:MAG: hypothetical protein IJS36_05380, partial [Kiritimatiellae bacterium]|nr:hypothetical protein [Kiritimatiellia bacterium]